MEWSDCTRRSFITCTLHLTHFGSPKTEKERCVTICSTDVETSSSDHYLAEKSEEKKTLGRSKIKQMSSTELDLKKTGCNGEKSPGG